MNKISPFLWFDDDAEVAVKFYLAAFKQGRILRISHYPAGSPGPTGAVMTVEFELFGQTFIALNGGPAFTFTEAISLVVNCATQREVDTYWKKLSAGGKKSQCGWLRDKFGLWWQIVPEAMTDLFTDEDPAKSARVMQAMLQMSKLDLKQLQQAAEGAAHQRAKRSRR